MKVSISRKVKKRFQRALHKAGAREIGGMLFAEQLSPSDFRIIDFSLDEHSGSFASFRRDAVTHSLALTEFFDRTHHDYSRFNYLGEWHSHPSFSVQPSGADLSTMADIVSGAGSSISFAVLLIVRLRFYLWLESSLTSFAKGHDPQQSFVSID